MTDAQARLEACPTHRCMVCEALWVKHDDGTWSLKSNHCSQCCDNAPMGGQMIAVADLEAWRPTVDKFRRAASVRGMSDMRAYFTVRSIVEDAPRTPDAQPSSTDLPSSKLSLDTPIGNSSAHGGRKEKLTLGDWLREDNRTAQYRARQLALQLIEQQAHDLKAASQLSSETRPQEEGRSVPITASGPMPISGEINYGPVTQPSSTDEVERAFAAGFDACCKHYALPTGPNNRGILNHELEKFRAIASMVTKP